MDSGSCMTDGRESCRECFCIFWAGVTLALGVETAALLKIFPLGGIASSRLHRTVCPSWPAGGVFWKTSPPSSTSRFRRGGLCGSGCQAGWLQGRLRVFQGNEIRRSVEVET